MFHKPNAIIIKIIINSLRHKKNNKICLSLEKKVVSKEERIYTPKIIGEKLNRMKTSTEEVK